ncbi:ArsR/SmtB family transcription factor [Georgenia sp. Z1344]|uniref:ArsR/SmtB family transcription factor n=1 Tax=Georgenia sp. Z1344 TaxID=3416706 RepID=UPI003CF5F873
MQDDSLDQMFAALADRTRRDIVARLAEGDATLTELAEGYPFSVQAVAKHIAVLERAGVVTRTRDAQRRPIHLEAEVLAGMTTWIELYRARAEDRFRRLDAVLDSMDDDAATDITASSTSPKEQRP